MKMTTQYFLQSWAEARTRFTRLLDGLTEADLRKKLGSSPNSAGFLLRHIADVELLFAKNVFGQDEVRVHAKTVIAKRDTGEWANLPELLDYQQYAADCLQKAIEAQPDEAWGETVTTQEFGTKTKAAAMGRITSHTAYHAGQLGMVLKYGTHA